MRQKNRINKAFYIMTVPMAILFFRFCRVCFTALRTGKDMETGNL